MKYKMDDYLFVEIFEWKFRDGALCVFFDISDSALNFLDVILGRFSVNLHKGQLHLPPFKILYPLK